MSIDIEQAVEAAAKTLATENGHGTWEYLSPMTQFHIREAVMPIVEAAVNSIAEQAWYEGYENAFQEMLGEGNYKNPYVEEEA